MIVPATRALSYAALVALVCLSTACDDVPKEVVVRCVPAGADCESFMGANAHVEPDRALGGEIFSRQCATCHGRDGRGNGFPDRGDFSAPDWHKKWSDSELFGIIKAGRGAKMPGFRLPPRELKSVTLYLRSLDASRGKSDARIKKKEGQGPYMGP